ncbi:putative zinc finger protein [Apostichopus japonicus]|uniref:Putative zinc finger protein n=2 Tax=Stichopus japonicus TaxID=307972 RepID=A0A2G8LHT5_STIJA|nr:putative zinc finger protein [Apostichopus japonicus]
MDAHSGKLYTCNICGKVMASCSRYIHRKLHSSKSRQKCSVCGKNVQNLTVHMRTHTGEKPIKCRYCDKRFAVHGGRQIHEISHTGERPYNCTICDKSWKDRNCYRTHMTKNHPGE